MKSVITCDMEGVIETINPDGEKLFGYSKEELVGKKRVSLFSAEEYSIVELVAPSLELSFVSAVASRSGDVAS